MKAKQWTCNNCWKDVVLWILVKNKWRCNDCYTTKEQIVDDNNIVDCSVLINKKFEFKLYSVYELNKKHRKDYNSITKEKICIKYNNWYILKDDIVRFIQDSLDHQPTEYDNRME